MRNESKNHTDGFGRGKEDANYVPSNKANYSELRWGKNKSDQNVHYLHGTLPFFDGALTL